MLACHRRPYGQCWSSTLARRYALTLECYTRATPAHAGVLHSRDAIRRSADDGCIPLSSDVQHLPRSCPASPQTAPTSAFERHGVSAMRPSCVTADGRRVLLSSNVLPQP